MGIPSAIRIIETIPALSNGLLFIVNLFAE